MGLGEKLGYGIGALAIVGFLIYIFRNRLVSGASTVGSTIGEAFGSGIASIPGGFLKPFAPFAYADTGGGYLGSAPPSTPPASTGKRDFPWWWWIVNPTDAFFKSAYGETAPSDSSDAYGVTVNPNLEGGWTLSSYAANVARINAINAARKPSPFAGASFKVGAKVGQSYGGAAPASSQARKVGIGSSSISKSAAGKKAQAAARARAASRKSGKCYNTDLDMGGVQEIRARQFGVVPMHG